MKYPKISVVIATYSYPDGVSHLKQSLDLLAKQTFQDFEIVVSDDSLNDEIRNLCAKYPVKYPVRYIKNLSAPGISTNTNNGILYANGELLKFLSQDDYLTHPESLQVINDNFEKNDHWLVTGCTHTNGHNHFPSYNDQIHRGINTIGSPSVLTIRNKNPLLFDTKLGWVSDCDYYKRLYQTFGLPKIVNDINVMIRQYPEQTTNKLSDDFKAAEIKFLIERYS